MPAHATFASAIAELAERSPHALDDPPLPKSLKALPAIVFTAAVFTPVVDS